MGQARKNRAKVYKAAVLRHEIDMAIRDKVEQSNFNELLRKGIIKAGGGIEKAKPPKGPGVAIE